MAVKLNRHAPKTIQFEGLARCNAHCTFCPITGDMTRGRGEMSDELFHKIIREGKMMRAKRFSPFLNGEPFLHSKIFDWLDYMEKEDVTIALFTNVSLLNKEKIDKLVKNKKIKHIVCSINAATKETHEKVMRLKNFDRVVENVKYLIEKAPFKIICGFAVVEDNKHEVEQFKTMWGKYAHINDYVNWGGTRHDPMEMTGKRVPCHHLNHIYILWDGRVCLCCFDYDGRVILGDINKQSLREIWDSEIYRDIRERHKKLDFDMDLCRNCNVNCKKERFVWQ